MKVKASPTANGLWVDVRGVEGRVVTKAKMNWGVALKFAIIINSADTVEITHDFNSFSFEAKKGGEEVLGIIYEEDWGKEAIIFGKINYFERISELGNAIMRFLSRGTTLGDPDGPILDETGVLEFMIYLDPETGKIKNATIEINGKKIELEGKTAL